jgi:hypothetical protein
LSDLEEFGFRLETLSKLDKHSFTACQIASIAMTCHKLFSEQVSEVLFKTFGKAFAKRLVELYSSEWKIKSWTPQLLADALGDLERRIEGECHVEIADGSKIIMKVTRCPFGNELVQSTGGSLCQIEKHISGAMVENASIPVRRLTLDTSIGRGDDSCLIVIELESEKRERVSVPVSISKKLF